MKNTSSPQLKKRLVFLVREKPRRKKSKMLISSPLSNRPRCLTEPINSQLAILKRQIRIDLESKFYSPQSNIQNYQNQPSTTYLQLRQKVMSNPNNNSSPQQPYSKQLSSPPAYLVPPIQNTNSFTNHELPFNPSLGNNPIPAKRPLELSVREQNSLFHKAYNASGHSQMVKLMTPNNIPPYNCAKSEGNIAQKSEFSTMSYSQPTFQKAASMMEQEQQQIRNPPYSIRKECQSNLVG